MELELLSKPRLKSCALHSAGFITANATYTTNVTFYLGSDDASALYINNTLICTDSGAPQELYHSLRADRGACRKLQASPGFEQFGHGQERACPRFGRHRLVRDP